MLYNSGQSLEWRRSFSNRSIVMWFVAVGGRLAAAVVALLASYVCASTLLVGRQEGHPACKNWVVGCWRGGLRWCADLHIAQQMPLPVTISCSSKSRLVTFLVLPFWYLLTRVVPDKFQKGSKMVVCVCVCLNQKLWNIEKKREKEKREHMEKCVSAW